MEVQEKSLVSLRIEKLREPDPDAEIPVGLKLRNRIERNFLHRARVGRSKVFANAYVGFLFYVLLSLALSLAAVPLARFLLAPVRTREIIDGYRDLFVSHFGANSPGVLSGVFAWTLTIVVAWVLLIVGIRIIVFLVDAMSATGNKNAKPERRKFNPEYAREWSEEAATAIKNCTEVQLADALMNFHKDVDIPFRIIKGFLPVPIGELRRPAEQIEGVLSEKKLNSRHQKIFQIDALSGGVLFLLGTDPSVRFKGDPTVAHDIYWRNDTFEVPDADQSDIFLRYHTSTVELQPDRTCYYKCFAALNNHRRLPVLLLTVKDVVDCLTNATGEYDEHHDLFFDNMDSIGPLEILPALQRDKFRHFPPRFERAVSGVYSPETRDGPILEKGVGDDWIMAFDPARVWVVDNEGQKYVQALVVLRNAIFLASRKKSVGVHLKKRDLLVVDNRRVLVARQEDGPGISGRDFRAWLYPSLAGRWIRKIYGFPPDGEPRLPDNFQKPAATAVKDSSSVELPPNDAVSAQPNQYAQFGFPDKHCGDVLFDYGDDERRWPDWLSE